MGEDENSVTGESGNVKHDEKAGFDFFLFLFGHGFCRAARLLAGICANRHTCSGHSSSPLESPIKSTQLTFLTYCNSGRREHKNQFLCSPHRRQQFCRSLLLSFLPSR